MEDWEESAITDYTPRDFRYIRWAANKISYVHV